LPSAAERFQLRLPVSKLDDESGEVTGWAAISTEPDGTPVIDHHDEHIPVAELRKAAAELVLAGGRGRAGEMHDRRVGDVIESMVFDKAKAKALGFGDGSLEGWAVTLKLLDAEARERARNGERPELSIYGTAVKKRVGDTPVRVLSKLKVDEISIVDAGASGNDKVTPRIVLAKRRDDDDATLEPWLVRKIKQFFAKQQEPTMPTLEDILTKMPEEDRNVILAAIEAAKPAPAPAPAPVPAPTVAPTAEEMAKALEGLPEPVRKALEAKLEAKDTSDAEREQLAKRVATLEAEREFQTFVAKAKALPHLAGKSTEQIAKLLQAASKGLEGEDYESVIKLLVTADAAVAKSALLRDVGSPLPADEDSPEGQLQAIAKNLREKDPSLSEAAAMVKAAEENQELYNARREAQA